MGWHWPLGHRSLYLQAVGSCICWLERTSRICRRYNVTYDSYVSPLLGITQTQGIHSTEIGLPETWSLIIVDLVGYTRPLDYENPSSAVEGSGVGQ